MLCGGNRLGRIHRVFVGDILARLLAGPGRIPLARSQPVEGLVPCDPEDPGLDRRATLKAPSPSPDLQHHFIQYVGGLERIVHSREDESVNRVLVAVVELGHGGLLAGRDPPQQGFAVDILDGPWLQVDALGRGQGQ